ncbi:MAG: 5-oxoprolinase subunit PxpB, partial [Thermomicrobiales bacterium]
MTEDHGPVRLPRIQPFGDGALLATFGDRIEVALSRRIGALVAALDARVDEGTLPGVIDLVPSYTTLVVILDPRQAHRAAVGETIRALWHDHDHDGHPLDHAPAEGRTIEIPVRYGGEAGPDLMAVATHAGLTPDEVIARHAAGRYVVGALGFSPGFAFLIGLDPALATPRRATPRTAVPPGSVGIGGAQTGVYAQATPGGWSLIGRTPLRLARPEVADPARAFLMRAGDAVRFVPIDDARFAELEAGQALATTRLGDVGDEGTPPALTVLAPGLQTTVQDLGRPRLGRYGISPGGAADRTALVEANRAVGNPDDAAGLEITLSGPVLRVLRPVRIAVAGADLGAVVNGFPLARGVAYDLRAGDTVAFDSVRTAGGLRAYLALAGGIEVPVILGSRATDLTAGMGGVEGRSLGAGDVLRVGTARRDGS